MRKNPNEQKGKHEETWERGNKNNHPQKNTSTLKSPFIL
jgi:hypothetical protein